MSEAEFIIALREAQPEPTLPYCPGSGDPACPAKFYDSRGGRSPFPPTPEDNVNAIPKFPLDCPFFCRAQPGT